MLIYYNLFEREFQELLLYKFVKNYYDRKEYVETERRMAEKRKKFEVPEQKETGVRINKYLSDLGTVTEG